MSQNQLINYKSTHTSESLLDHVYIHRQTLQKISIEAIPTVHISQINKQLNLNRDHFKKQGIFNFTKLKNFSPGI